MKIKTAAKSYAKITKVSSSAAILIEKHTSLVSMSEPPFLKKVHTVLSLQSTAFIEAYRFVNKKIKAWTANKNSSWDHAALVTCNLIGNIRLHFFKIVYPFFVFKKWKKCSVFPYSFRNTIGIWENEKLKWEHKHVVRTFPRYFEFSRTSTRVSVTYFYNVFLYNLFYKIMRRKLKCGNNYSIRYQSVNSP